MIETEHLEKALKRLRESLGYTQIPLAQNDPAIGQQFQMATIQAFEFTYELVPKMIKRYLYTTELTAQSIEDMNLPDIIRAAADRGLLPCTWDSWKKFRDARSAASSTAHEEHTDKVFNTIPIFIETVQYLINQIKKKQEVLLVL